jgi:GNAT superfamily N-acetyltransferase
MSTPEPTIRMATPADRDLLVAFGRAMALETEQLELDLDTVRAGVVALLADPARGRVFVADIGGEAAATLMLTDEWSDWRNGFFWWIQSVYVAPAHRRRGLYRLLHEHVRDLAARTEGVCGLRLYVERENRTAQATYRRMGMHETHYRLYEQSVGG